jgi:hypothetical protein
MRKRIGPDKRLLRAVVASVALGLTSTVGAPGALAVEGDDVQAPRGVGFHRERHAPRGQHTPARGDEDTQTPGTGETIRAE